jgi:hypothetical protein
LACESRPIGVGTPTHENPLSSEIHAELIDPEPIAVIEERIAE